MLQTLEYILIGAIVVLALALICYVVVVTARKAGCARKRACQEARS